MIVTIDGPVASGKSTVAKRLAKLLGAHYLQTGLLYRAVAYVLQTHFALPLEELATISPADIAFVSDISYEIRDDKPTILFRGEDITDQLHATAIADAASRISALPFVREALMEIQRAAAAKGDTIADGRDCGSIVFPHAEHKFFLTASVEVRAQRLLGDAARAATMTEDDAIEAINERDARDEERTVAPLIVPKDGEVVDSSELTIEQVVQHMLVRIQS